MRKNYQMWLLGALFGGLVLPFAGCSNEDDPISNGPGNGETVKTEFTVKFTHGNQTKAGEAEVGSSTSFAGMEKINLLGYSDPGGSWSTNYVTGDYTLTDKITLSNMEAGLSNDFVKKYNISLQPEKQSFMFYGESSVNSANSGVGKLTATYPSASAAANKTTFALEELAEPTTTEMQSYLQNVIQAAVGVVDAGHQSQLQNFLANCKSPALYQVASMLDQLYFNTTLWGTGAVSDAVQNAIKASNLVFSSFDGSSEGELLARINTDNVDYLGDLYPRGGKTLKITCDFGASTNSTVEFEDNANTFYRPTSLYYMANSYLVAYTSDGPTWSNGVCQEGDGTFVDLSSSTPSKVALYDQIQYAVGQLLVNFIVEETSLSGNEGTPANISASSIKLKGIIIGNQKQAGWDFMPKDTKGSDAAYDNTGVEDKDGTSNVYGTMRMLALPTEAQQPITIALELENASSTSFEGANGGTIPAGATFYVTAKLDPRGQTVPNMANEDVAVFMSDYVTTANLKLASLKYAENTVPDLDDANLEFALSVNLDWESGVTFDVEIP